MLAALLLSVIGFFLPISFAWDDFSNYVVNWFIAVINCENEPVFLKILTFLALLAAVIAVVIRKLLIIFIYGILVVILFVTLLILVPDAKQQVYDANVVRQIAIHPDTYFAPSAATAGAVVSLVAFLSGRKEKRNNHVCMDREKGIYARACLVFVFFRLHRNRICGYHVNCWPV